MGALTRRVARDRVMTGAPVRRRSPRSPRGPRAPRVVELLRKAQEWRRQLEAAEIPNQAAIARQEGITRARVTQVLGLLRLSPEIQEHILSIPDTASRPCVTERTLRPIVRIKAPHDQFEAFCSLGGTATSGSPHCAVLPRRQATDASC